MYKRVINLLRSLHTKHRRERAAHRQAREYWRSSSNTFLASDPSYYDRQEQALRQSIIPLLGRVESAVDIGCGNGRFSLVLAEHASHVRAIDISPTLIEEAAHAATHAGVTNVSFEVRDLEAKSETATFDLVSCMGVVSTLIRDDAFVELSRYMAKSTNPGGFLILKDTLSLRPEGEFASSETYVTKYRNIDAYEKTFLDLGFRERVKVLMAKQGDRVNYLYLLNKEPGR